LPVASSAQRWVAPNKVMRIMHSRYSVKIQGIEHDAQLDPTLGIGTKMKRKMKTTTTKKKKKMMMMRNNSATEYKVRA
jgi:hypothetical protein